MAAKGCRATEIAKHLNMKGIPNNSKTNGIWDTKLITKKIHDEIYIGNLVQGKIEIVGFVTAKKPYLPIPQSGR